MTDDSQPVCNECDTEIADEETWVSVNGGTVHRGEMQGDAGGGHFHPQCAIAYIERVYDDN